MLDSYVDTYVTPHHHENLRRKLGFDAWDADVFPKLVRDLEEILEGCAPFPCGPRWNESGLGRSFAERGGVPRRPEDGVVLSRTKQARSSISPSLATQPRRSISPSSGGG